tara:strand:- start:7 stop:501 length:495 start_codon:yes stop_codon:yes gene_type:complete
MVSMDNSWTRSYSFPAQAIFTIAVSLLLYFTVVRQIRVKINSEFIYPVIVEKAEAVNAKVVFSPRRIGIIPVGHDYPRGFGIPFGGYFWLPFTLFLIGRDKRFALSLSIYHLFLCIAPPFAALLFMKGNNLAGTFLQINEMVFKLVFLICLLLGVSKIIRVLKK